MIVLGTSFFRAKSPGRRAEMRQSLVNNCNNQYIDLVVVVSESKKVKYPKHPKLLVIQRTNRPTFTELFGILSDINPDGKNVLCNSDIYFLDEDMGKIKGLDMADTVLTLTRYDDDGNGKLTFLDGHKDSQDTWIWQGRLSVPADFYMGQPGCDNRLAYLLASTGRTLISPSLNIKSCHLHNNAIIVHVVSETHPSVDPPYTFPEYVRHNDQPYETLLNVSMGTGVDGFTPGFKSFVPKYHQILYNGIIRQHGVDAFNEILIQEAHRIKPDIIFMQCHDIGSVRIETLERLMKEVKPKVIINWTGDVGAEGMPKWYYDLMPYVVTCYSNEDYLIAAGRSGYRAYYFNWFDEFQYAPKGSPNIYDIVFSGSKYTQFPLSHSRNQMVEFLHQTFGDETFHVFGNGCPFGQFATRPQMAEIYERTKIGINFSQAKMQRYTSDRMYHIMASGALCISQWFPYCEKDFIDGVHCRFFKSREEMVKLIKYYLKNKKERAKIAKAGNKIVRERFGVQNLKRVIDRIYQFHS